MKYIVSFYVDYDAFAFSDYLKKQGINGKLGPLPRKLSATCGLCVTFEGDEGFKFDAFETECVYIEIGHEEYKKL